MVYKKKKSPRYKFEEGLETNVPMQRKRGEGDGNISFPHGIDMTKKKKTIEESSVHEKKKKSKGEEENLS